MPNQQGGMGPGPVMNRGGGMYQRPFYGQGNMMGPGGMNQGMSRPFGSRGMMGPGMNRGMNFGPVGLPGMIG
uniref:Cytoadhesion protein n=1 Tax=Parastrongyloides trichosuri TaxID=131310 RepID=A0A0N5A2W0_PARTI